MTTRPPPYAPKLFMMVFGTLLLNGFLAFIAVLMWFSKMPPWKALVPLFEMVVMSLVPPNSAVLLISLTRISAIVLNDGNNSANGAEERGPMLLMPSMLTDSMLGLEP